MGMRYTVVIVRRRRRVNLGLCAFLPAPYTALLIGLAELRRWLFARAQNNLKQSGLGWVGVNYGYWIIDPHLGTFLWPPTSVYAL